MFLDYMLVTLPDNVLNTDNQVDLPSCGHRGHGSSCVTKDS